MKYQEMLKNDTEKNNDNSLEVKTDPTDSDLQTGCFTDVSFAGYFASKKVPETISNDKSLHEVFHVGNYTDLNKGQKQICETMSSKSLEPNIGVDIIIKEESQNNNEGCKSLNIASLENTANMKIFETNITPTPSPRIKRRLRREQFLQEHKQMGKVVLAMAKTQDSEKATPITKIDTNNSNNNDDFKVTFIVKLFGTLLN